MEKKKQKKPEPRSFTCAVIYNDFLYIYGGKTNAKTVLNDFWKWKQLKSKYRDHITNTQACLYKNEMVFFGGYFQGPLNDIVRINLDNFYFIVTQTDIPASYWHCSCIWRNELVIFGSSLKFFYFFNLETNQYRKVKTLENLERNPFVSYFIHQENLYFTSNTGLYKLDLNSDEITKIEIEISHIIKSKSSIFYYNDSIYYFGGRRDQIVSNDFYKIDFKTLEIQKLQNYELKTSYSHSGFLYNNEFIIYGVSDSEKSYENVVRISLPMKLYEKTILKVFERLDRDIIFIFDD